MQTRADAVRYADAEEMARELANISAGVYAKVGFHRTNGAIQYVVHVTHKPNEDGDRPEPYTIPVR